VIDSRRIACLVSELTARRIDGLALLRPRPDAPPEICVVFVVSDASVRARRGAMREGAYDVQVPPLHPDRLLAVLRAAFAHQNSPSGSRRWRASSTIGSGSRASPARRHIHSPARTRGARWLPTGAPVNPRGEPAAGRHRLAQ